MQQAVAGGVDTDQLPPLRFGVIADSDSNFRALALWLAQDPFYAALRFDRVRFLERALVRQWLLGARRQGDLVGLLAWTPIALHDGLVAIPFDGGPERRLAPAMETCASAAVRQETLATKVARTNDLLRTGVSLAQERHNQEILEQMNRNAQLQLRLQHAVEGLSVVAITYYVLGLTGYLLKAGKGMGLPLNVDAALGLMMPLACGLTWFGIRRMKHRIAKDGGSHA